ncbi:MAG: hypothetical protein NE330_16920, partial [Lentisphaeraceae bacterium]|nr:hypothetical protein [Lentisphaeraceae bacterium]
MKSRGPDAQALCQGPNWVLGHTRLSIIDIQGGVQPMKDPATGVTVSYNGEIYNFEELKNELVSKGHSFKTTSDTEVLLYSYIEWGTDAVQRFNGCFAFAVADPTKKQVLLFRDRLGIKPLYYIYEEGRLVFGSSVAAILKITGKREIDKEALSHYFTSCRIT